MIVLEDIKVLSKYLNENNIPFVLTGTASLMVHGLLPDSYSPDDIDVIILVNPDDKNYEAVQQHLLHLQHLAGEKSNDYPNVVITFRANGKKVNAFMGSRELADNGFINYFNESSSFVKILISEGLIINVSSVVDALKAKFHLKRTKDYMFVKDLTLTILNL